MQTVGGFCTKVFFIESLNIACVYKPPFLGSENSDKKNDMSSFAMYEAQRKQVQKLFHEHAMQQAAESATRFQFLKARHGRAFAAPAGPVFLRGVRPILSTAPYSKHTPQQIAVLKHEHAERALQQATLQFEESQEKEAIARQHLQQLKYVAAADSIQQAAAEWGQNFSAAATVAQAGSMHRAHKHIRF